MDYYALVKNYYGKGYYTKEQVGVFVERGKITAEQYEEITSEAYTA